MARFSGPAPIVRVATTAGVVTAIAGPALLGAPERVGPAIGLTAKRDAQLVGALDLALAPGLLFGRPRWPWLMARAISNLATAGFVLRRAADDASRRNARRFSGVMVLATLTDLRALRAVTRSDRQPMTVESDSTR
jgi:hypothetical protein